MYSDHKNLVVHATTLSQSQRVMRRWRLILKEFGPDIQHVRGEDNVVADALSRLDTVNEEEVHGCTEEMKEKFNNLYVTESCFNSEIFVTMSNPLCAMRMSGSIYFGGDHVSSNQLNLAATAFFRKYQLNKLKWIKEIS